MDIVNLIYKNDIKVILKIYLQYSAVIIVGENVDGGWNKFRSIEYNFGVDATK